MRCGKFLAKATQYMVFSIGIVVDLGVVVGKIDMIAELVVVVDIVGQVVVDIDCIVVVVDIVEGGWAGIALVWLLVAVVVVVADIGGQVVVLVGYEFEHIVDIVHIVAVVVVLIIVLVVPILGEWGARHWQEPRVLVSPSALLVPSSTPLPSGWGSFYQCIGPTRGHTPNRSLVINLLHGGPQ